MDRNDFVGIFTPASGCGLISSDTVLSADKYSVAVIKAREVVALDACYKSDKSPEVLERLSLKLDRLLGFLMSQFKTPASTEEVRRIMQTTDTNALNEDELVKLSDGLVPVAIVRELLNKHRVFINPKTLNNWDTFAARYMSQVLHA
jgi:hypothetical protein